VKYKNTKILENWRFDFSQQQKDKNTSYLEFHFSQQQKYKNPSYLELCFL